MENPFYFAYGSNMNLDQMEFRCPAAVVKENVRLDGYRLAFCGRHPGCGVATIMPEKGSHVDGVLWKITPLVMEAKPPSSFKVRSTSR